MNISSMHCHPLSPVYTRLMYFILFSLLTIVNKGKVSITYDGLFLSFLIGNNAPVYSFFCMKIIASLAYVFEHTAEKAIKLQCFR